MADKKKPAYKRILLKLSGEALNGSSAQSVDFDAADRIAREVKAVWKLGVETAIVIGGGNIFRGNTPKNQGMDRTTADYMGMLATVINALALQHALEKNGVPTRVLTSIEISRIAEPFILRRAVRHMEKGRVVVFAAGTGNPYFTTDTAAALRASEIHANVLLKATKVDGIYDNDPVKEKTASMYTELTYMDVLKKKLRVMDSTAISMCMENNIAIIVFNMNTESNILRVVHGEKIGTIVREN